MRLGGLAAKSGKNVRVKTVADAAQVKDPEALINPQFFPIPASPYTASENLGLKVDVELILSSFKKLSELHQMLLVEGMGGIMTPILKDYYVSDLIKEMNLETIVVTSSRIGTVNHTIMTCKMCELYGIQISGIIINDLDSNGYPLNELQRDIENLTGTSVLGTIPKMENLNLDVLTSHISNTILPKLT